MTAPWRPIRGRDPGSGQPVDPLLVLMCGLPGSGKSTLSRLLADRIGALCWDKDAVRDLLFPVQHVPHDRALNDLCMDFLYAGALHVFRRHPARAPAIILDGRPFTLRAQRERAADIAAQGGARALFVLCTAPLPILKERVAAGSHPAPDRGPELVDRLASEMEPFAEPAPIEVDTASATPDQASARCLQAMRLLGHLC